MKIPMSNAGNRSQEAMNDLRLLVFLAVWMLGWWLALVPGLKLVVNLAESTAGQRVPVTAPAQAPAVSSVTHAKQVLLETAPEKYDDVVNIDQPLVAQVPQGTTYTWEYVSNPGENVAQVKSISLTLDAAGNLVGVDIP